MRSRFSSEDLIEVTLKGGLGNQLFQFAFGLNSAIENGISLKLNSEWFLSQRFRQPLIGSLLGVALNVSLQVQEIDGNLELLPLSTRRHKKTSRVISQVEMHYNSMYLTEKNCTLDGYWQSERYFLENAPQIRNFVSERMNIGPKEESRLVVHVRRGDYLKKDTMRVHGILDKDYYHRALRLLNHDYNERILVIEDADQLEPPMLELVKQYSFQIVQKQSELEDLRLIASASHIVIANSTFSWWGAYLSNAEVICPRNWFSPEELRVQNICDVYPNGWVFL